MKYIKHALSCLSFFSTFLMSSLAFAANPTPAGGDPFPSPALPAGSDVLDFTGQHMETGMKYSLIGAGIIMILVGIGVIASRLREDSTNRDTGSFITTLIIAGLAITVGIILIAIAWTAASTSITPG